MGSELTPEVLADLRSKAEKATPGPWPENYVWGAVRHIARNVDRSLFCDDAEDATFNWNRYTDGHYIAAANPATVLALLDEIERMRADDSRRRDIEMLRSDLRLAFDAGARAMRASVWENYNKDGDFGFAMFATEDITKLPGRPE